MRHYKVKQNRCRCHPETCNCLDWVVCEGERKILPVFREDVAMWTAERLNTAERLEGAVREYISLLDRIEKFHPPPRQGPILHRYQRDIKRLPAAETALREMVGG